jgi:hypothetical protein
MTSLDLSISTSQIILNLVVCILLRVLDQVQVQGFRLTQHCLNTCLVFYSIATTCFGRMTMPEDGHTTETCSGNGIKY